MITSSMDRTLTTKSIRIGHWTAATTLVAAGTLALFSASTLEKLTGNGEVEIDLKAFRKLGSASLSLDRVDDQRLIAEEARLIDNAAYAAAEALPKTHTSFTKIRLHPKKRRVVQPVIAEKQAVSPEKRGPESPTPEQILAGSPVILSKSDEEEIAQLERAPDPANESKALAQVYRNLRFQFMAAADREPSEEFSAESVAVAQSTDSFEYDELPEFKEADFAFPEKVKSTVAVATPEISAIDLNEVETAPAKLEIMAAAVPAEKSEDSISISSSATLNDLTADAAVMKVAKSQESIAPTKSLTSFVAPIVSPGLDFVPEAVAAVASPERVVVNTHQMEVKQATGPPETSKFSKNSPPTSLHAKSPSGLDANPEKHNPSFEKSAKLMAPKAPDYSGDIREYSKDVAAAYQGMPADGVDTDEQPGEYSNGAAEDSIIDGDFSARPKTITSNRVLVAPAKQNQDYGHGIHKDEKGITINWNEDATGSSLVGGKVSATELGGKVYVGRPGQGVAANDAEIQNSLKKFSFTSPAQEKSAKVISTSQASAVAAEPAVDTKKCETARIGVEAFNSGAEKETLSICRRELSLEGSNDGAQARWWESYENESEHWPTLSFAKSGDASSANRTPLLSNASIRILSAISKTNTHTGTGIIFGEVAKGLEIQLLGRSDSPIYLDAGMKLREPAADVIGSRQFVFLNVEPGQPLLVVKNREKNLSGAIPLVVKSGMATNLKVQEPREMDLALTVFDASSAKEARLANLTAEVIGQPGKMGITDRNGTLKIPKVAVFEEFPIYVDLLKNEKSYKNRFRIRPGTLARGALPLFFFDEKRVGGWLSQLAGGLSPYSGLIAGVAPRSAFGKTKDDARFLKIGILEKKSSLVPERYLLDAQEHLVSDSALRPNRARYVGVQIPEGPAVPTIVDAKGVAWWSELVYAQPGVINVINPEL